MILGVNFGGFVRRSSLISLYSVFAMFAVITQPALGGEFNLRPRLLPSGSPALVCAAVLAVGGVTCGVGTCLYKEDTATKPEVPFITHNEAEGSSSKDAAPVLPDLPNTFTVRERIFSIGDKFEVEDDKNSYGVVDEKIWHIAKTFTYQRQDGTVVAKAHTKIFSWGTKIVVEDANGHKIGTIKEDVWQSLIHPMSKYEIWDANDHAVAVSKKSEWLTTDFDLYSVSNGDHIANIHRGYFN